MTKQSRCCPECGRPLPLVVDLGGPVRQHIYDFIANNPGTTRDAIMRNVYADDPNGGPESCNVVSVHVCNINKRLLDLGFSQRIRSRGGPGATYEIVEVL